ncbi:hypothetical protein N7509_004183 [Penicillium cosmopolitanum]|uniref:DUF7721 domain-containing protein n=1 Tax=Penicillium cosmopolitanum TaxID=1131564 RepID=A0A9W9W6I6_9EURO|nr:uncharacterized protein N7509_004183 [Penicillium cosmopolitanum]KAJ5404312.1 hypothetical protein N7509_004183 [Penicillium cosmopolitanum]
MSYNDYNSGGNSGASANYYDQNADFRDTRYNGPPSYSNENQHDDFSSAAHHASQEHSSEDRSFFDSALSFVKERRSEYADTSKYEVDEAHAMNAHQAMYGGGSDERSHDSGTVGAGAAMQALKMFTGGGSGVVVRMGASKLWDEKNASGNVSGDKQSAVNSAAEMALKMYMKGGSGGIGGTGGAGGLMSLASKFL